jgi:phosphate transport system substrate-binding protein
MRPDIVKRSLALSLVLPIALALGACSREEAVEEGTGEGLTGTVEIDGSSTVFPISMAVAEDFQQQNPGAQVTVAFAGTGGGFKRFCAGETDISDASRPISEDEKALCAAAGIEYSEIKVAWDGLAVVVHPSEAMIECLTKAELKKIWEPNSKVTTWKDVRASLPATKISLFGPGTDSGTFDYFTEAVVGTAKASRADYQASEDDNILVQGVSGDSGSLGYFGFAYYLENQDKIKLVAVDGGSGCVLPSDATIEDHTYPLSRPLFIYVKKASMAKPVVAGYVRYYLEHGGDLVKSAGYHPLSADEYQASLGTLPAAPATP